MEKAEAKEGEKHAEENTTLCLPVCKDTSSIRLGTALEPSLNLNSPLCSPVSKNSHTAGGRGGVGDGTNIFIGETKFQPQQ